MEYKSYEPSEVSTYRQVAADSWHNQRQELTSVLLADLYKDLAEKQVAPVGVVSVHARPMSAYEGEYYQVRAFVSTMYLLVDYQIEGEGE